MRAAMVVADNVANSNMGTALEYAYRWYGVRLFMNGSRCPCFVLDRSPLSAHFAFASLSLFLSLSLSLSLCLIFLFASTHALSS